MLQSKADPMSDTYTPRGRCRCTFRSKAVSASFCARNTRNSLGNAILFLFNKSVYISLSHRRGNNSVGGLYSAFVRLAIGAVAGAAHIQVAIAHTIVFNKLHQRLLGSAILALLRCAQLGRVLGLCLRQASSCTTYALLARHHREGCRHLYNPYLNTTPKIFRVKLRFST